MVARGLIFQWPQKTWRILVKIRQSLYPILQRQWLMFRSQRQSARWLSCFPLHWQHGCQRNCKLLHRQLSHKLNGEAVEKQMVYSLPEVLQHQMFYSSLWCLYLNIFQSFRDLRLFMGQLWGNAIRHQWSDHITSCKLRLPFVDEMLLLSVWKQSGSYLSSQTTVWVLTTNSQLNPLPGPFWDVDSDSTWLDWLDLMNEWILNGMKFIEY